MVHHKEFAATTYPITCAKLFSVSSLGFNLKTIQSWFRLAKLQLLGNTYKSASPYQQQCLDGSLEVS